MQVNDDVDGPVEKPRARLAVALAGGALAITAAVGVAIGVGVLPVPSLMPRGQQPATQLTISFDRSAVPQLVARTLSEEVRGLMRETRIGFAAMAPSGDSVDVTLREGIDRAPAIVTCRDRPERPSAPPKSASPSWRRAATC
jgi:hypothetical protein